jgi:ribosomal protein S18 acetylase RimI-like enzyme
MMVIAGCEVTLATRGDIPGILSLQERNLRRHGGALAIRFSREWFEEAISEMPIIVARTEGRTIAGYLVSTSLTAQAHEPIIQAILRVYPGSPGAYLYGPICVAETHRRRGLAVAMFEELRARLPRREGFTFIRLDNVASREVHAKMGMQEVAEFIVEEIGYVVVAYQG